MVMTTYHHMFRDTRTKNIYGMWVGISIVFKILEHLWCKGDGTILYGHDQHTIKCSVTQGWKGLTLRRPSLLYDRFGRVKNLFTSPTGRVKKNDKKLISKWQDILF
jgi:hypothetical protein